MASRKWLAVFAALLFLTPNFSLAKTNLDLSTKLETLGGLSIQEVKAKSSLAPSHYGEWLEIMNTTEEKLDLGDFCLLNDRDYVVDIQRGLKEPKNCFPSFSLGPKEVVIVAYSAFWFLSENGFELNVVEEEIESGSNLKDIFGGYLFELKETGESSLIEERVPNLENLSLSRAYLSDKDGSLYIITKSGEIVDSFVWQEAEKESSWQKPVYSQNLPFVSFAPTPFVALPEFIEVDLDIGFQSVNLSFERLGGPLAYEQVSLYQGNKTLASQSFVDLDKIGFSQLKEDTDYRLVLEACDNYFCFQKEVFFKTKKHYPLIWLNELYPAPKSGEKEFVELYNPNNFSVDLDGWQLQDKAKNIFFLSGVIKAKSFLVFYPNFALNNDQEELMLFDPNKEKSDSVSYEQALGAFSYSRFGSKWKWSREITPGAENVFKPQFLPSSVREARQLNDWVELKAKVVIPNNVFASSCLYIAQDNWALKVKIPLKQSFAFNSCFLWQGKVEQTQEPYLKLLYFQPAIDCPDFYFKKANLGSLVLGQLVSIKAEIESKRGGYFIKDTDLKVRAPFKLKKSQGSIKALVGLGSKYRQLFIYLPQWIKYMVESEDQVSILSKGNSNKEMEGSKSSKDVFLRPEKLETKVSGVSLKCEDFRQKTSNSDSFSYFWLFPYYFVLLSFLGLAKMLFFP